MFLNSKRITSRMSAQIAFLSLLFVFAPNALAATGLLTGPGIASSYQSIDDGNKLVYKITDSIFMPSDLMVKEIRDDDEIKLSDELGSEGRVRGYKVSPNESTVVYEGAKSDGGLNELYSVPISGGASTKLNVNLNSSNERITGYSITPDNKHVVYAVIRDFFFTTLYVVPISGGNSLKLGVESEVISLGEITSDSKFMLFTVRGLSDVNYSQHVYKADLSNGVVTQLSHNSLGIGFPDFPILKGDGQYAVYEYSSNIAEENGLYIVSVINGNPVKITPTLVAGGLVSHKIISPDGQFVYYVADQNVDNIRRLYRVPLMGGNSVEIISNFSPDRSISGNGSMRVNSQGTHAVFDVDNGMGFNNLYSVNLTTGIAIKLNTAGRVLAFKLSDDGAHVVFNADSETQELFELYSTAVDGSMHVKLNMDYSNAQNTSSGINYDISPDSNRVVYWADLDGDFKEEVLEVPISGGTSTPLSPELQSGSSIGFPEYSLDGSLVLFSISQFMGVESGVYAFDFIKTANDELCFPVIAANRRAALVCL